MKDVATSIRFPSHIGALDCPSEPTSIVETSKLRSKLGSGDVDCLERNREFGSKAKHIISILLFAKGVEVDPVTVDNGDRGFRQSR